MLLHDIGTGALLAFGMLAALYRRNRDGLGQEVTTTMANTSVILQSGEFVRYVGRPEPAVGGYDHLGDSAAHRLYPCSDGWIAVAATGPEESGGIVAALGLGAAPLLDAPPDGPEADAVAVALAGLTVMDVLARLASHGVPVAPVLGQGGFLADPSMAASRMFTEIVDPDLGPCTVVRTYADWTRSRHDITTPAAAPGADTRDVLAGLGLDTERIEALIGSGAVVQAAD